MEMSKENMSGPEDKMCPSACEWRYKSNHGANEKNDENNGVPFWIKKSKKSLTSSISQPVLLDEDDNPKLSETQKEIMLPKYSCSPFEYNGEKNISQSSELEKENQFQKYSCSPFEMQVEENGSPSSESEKENKFQKYSCSSFDLHDEDNSPLLSETINDSSCYIDCNTKCDSSLKRYTKCCRNVSSKKKEIQGFSFRRLSRDKQFLLLSVFLSNVLTCIGFSLMAPFFPKEALARNVNNTLSGWIFGAFPAFQVLLNPFWGKLLPYIGIKRLYSIGIFVSGISTFLFGFLAYIDTSNGPEVFVTLCFVLRFGMAVGCAAVSTSSFTIIMVEFPDHLSTAISLSEVFIGLGYMTGPVLGGVLYYVGGFLLPFIFIGGLSLFFVPIGIFLFPEHKTPDLEKDESLYEAPTVIRLFKSPTVVLICFCIITTAIAFSVLDPTLEPHLRQFDWGPELVGLVFMMSSAIYSFVCPMWGYVTSIVSDIRILAIPGLGMSAIAMLLIGPTPLFGFLKEYNKIWLKLLSICVLSFFLPACLMPTYLKLFSVAKEIGFKDDIPTYSMVAAIWQSCYSLGDFAGPMCGGWMLEEIGFPIATTIVAGICIFNTICFAIQWMAEIIISRCQNSKGDYLPLTLEMETLQ